MRIARRSSRWFIVGDRLVGRSAELATTLAVCIAAAAWANVCPSPRQMNFFGNGRIATSRHLILGSFADLAPSSRPSTPCARAGCPRYSRTQPQGDGRARPALAGGVEGGECNLIVLDASDVLHDAFAVSGPRIDAEGEMRSSLHVGATVPKNQTSQRMMASAVLHARVCPSRPAFKSPSLPTH